MSTEWKPETMHVHAMSDYNKMNKPGVMVFTKSLQLNQYIPINKVLVDLWIRGKVVCYNLYDFSFLQPRIILAYPIFKTCTSRYFIIKLFKTPKLIKTSNKTLIVYFQQYFTRQTCFYNFLLTTYSELRVRNPLKLAL